ncbi:hypothetical protein [Labrys sp. 22185]|uniref:hypothetical protein n=1 Tax=Labrys sp. 22185 TaxID=3453888 RepID=UPI003F856152
MLRSVLAASAAIALFVQPTIAFAACQVVSASDVSNAIRNSSTANGTLQNASCDFGGAAMAESGGNTCASNGNNFGVLQLTRSNLPAGMTPQQYLNLPLQQQVDIWAQQVGNSNTSGGYGSLVNNASIGGTPVTAGMKAACFQFGPLICKKDIEFMQANNGQCPSAGNGGVRATGATLRNGTANLDGNNQSICSWGGAIQGKINQAAATCKSGGSCMVGPGDLPTNTTTQVASNTPVPGAGDIVVNGPIG